MNCRNILASLKGQLQIPITPEVSPFFPNFARFARERRRARVIPGTMASPGYVVRGKGSPESLTSV